MTLTLRFWGTRGSIPSPGATTVRYGGNTPCVELRAPDGSLLILDAGTGIRGLGQELGERAAGTPIVGDIFLSHAHWDHIQGLPFFAPLFQRGNHFRIWSSAALAPSVASAVRAQMSPPVFPVALHEIGATMEFQTLSDPCMAAGLLVDAFPARHPGGALGFRIRAHTSESARLVYLSDNELGDAHTYDCTPDWRDELVRFARSARVLVHDATFTPDEYTSHMGWGHSSYVEALALALDADVEQLVLFHHHPDRTDEEIDRQVAECRALVERCGARLEVLAAAEGMVLQV